MSQVKTDPKLGKRLATNFGAAMADLIFTKLINVIVFIVLVRWLDTNAIAAVGVATGYMVLLAYLDVSPIRILLRDYPTYKDNELKRNRLLTGMFVFWFVQSAAIMGVAAVLSSFLLGRHDLPDMRLLFIALATDYVIVSLGEWIKTIFYSDLRQGIATAISLGAQTIRLLSFGFLFAWPTLDTFSVITIAVSLVNGLVWGVFFLLNFHFRPKFDRHALRYLWSCLASYGVWDHLNRMTIDTLFLVDTVILSWVGVVLATVNTQAIADYSIALRFTSLLFIIPMQLRKALQIAIANAPERRREVESINMVLKFSILVALAQLVMVFGLGEWMLTLLFGNSNNAQVVLYVQLITVGVTVMACAMPLISVINNLASLRLAFVQVFLPVLVVGLALYVVAAAFGGATWMAAANIGVYCALTAGLIIFTVRQCPFNMNLMLLTDREKAILHYMARKVTGR